MNFDNNYNNFIYGCKANGLTSRHLYDYNRKLNLFKSNGTARSIYDIVTNGNGPNMRPYRYEVDTQLNRYHQNSGRRTR